MDISKLCNNLLLANRQSMELLKSGNFQATFTTLRDILRTLKFQKQYFTRDNFYQIKAITLNNLACYYRKYFLNQMTFIK